MHTSSLFQHMIANSNVIAASGRIVKLLNGESKYNVLAWMGAMLQDDVSNMLKVLDGMEHEIVKYNQLKTSLEKMQWKNTFMQFTLQRETVREFMLHQFDSAPNEKNMMKGFTPFCLKKWMNLVKLIWINLEIYHKGTSNLSVIDLKSRDNAVCTNSRYS